MFSASLGTKKTAIGALLGVALLVACSAENRVVDATPPQTPPNGPDDPRIPGFAGNLQQVSQGGRYFIWYGCSACHGAGAGKLSLDHGPRPFDQLFASIAHGHAQDYAARIPVEQLWQITGYVAQLPTLKDEQRRRQDRDQAGEPQGDRWTGAVR